MPGIAPAVYIQRHFQYKPQIACSAEPAQTWHNPLIEAHKKRALAQADVEQIIVGGAAVIAHGAKRFTLDPDMVAIVSRLLDLGQRPSQKLVVKSAARLHFGRRWTRHHPGGAQAREVIRGRACAVVQPCAHRFR